MPITGAKSLGNCSLYIMSLRSAAHWSCRYSNTLLVSLNNRIYFRDHPLPADSSNSIYQGSSRPSEPHLLQVKTLDVQVATGTTNDACGPRPLLSTVELGNGRDVPVLNLRCALRCSLWRVLPRCVSLSSRERL
jgi:hypothetical protein